MLTPVINRKFVPLNAVTDGYTSPLPAIKNNPKNEMGLFDKIFGKSNKIKVQFIDSSNGSVIGVSEMPPEQLPETFEIQTTMHLNDEDWSIEEAIPAHSKDFLHSMSLTFPSNCSMPLLILVLKNPRPFRRNRFR